MRAARRAFSIIKRHTIQTPQVLTPATGTAVYANYSFTMTSSPYVGSFAGAPQRAEWEIADATGTIWTGTSSGASLTSITSTLGMSVVTPVRARVRHRSVAGVVSQWSPYLTLSFEYGLPFAPLQSTQIFAVSHPEWSNWMNAHAVWVGEPGDDSVLIGQYMSVQQPLNIPSNGTYRFHFQVDDALRVVVNGTTIVDFSDPDFLMTDPFNFALPNPLERTMYLESGVYNLVVTGYNKPQDNPENNTWAMNPGGFALVVVAPNNNVVFDLRDVANAGGTSFYCLNGGTYSPNDGMCHLYSPPV